MYVLWLAGDRRCLMCLLGVSLRALNLGPTLFSLFCWPGVSHHQPATPAQLQRESFVASSLPWRIEIGSIDEGTENFFPPLSHGWCRKKIVPHTCLRRYWLWISVISTSVSISRVQPEPFEARGQEIELATEPEQHSGNQYVAQPLWLRKTFPVWATVAKFSPQKDSSEVF